jgi:hypothetical protein
MRPHHVRLVILGLTSTLLAAACGDDKNTTGGSSDTGVASTGGLTDGTVGVSSEPTTGGADGTAEGTAEGTAGMTTADATSTTSEPNPTEVDPTTTEPGTTTGPVDPGIVDGCMALCSKAVECEIMQDIATCTAECSDGFGDAEGQCKKATKDFLECVAGMTCEELTALFGEEDPGQCAAQQTAQSEACGEGDLCGVAIGSNPEGTECSMQIECEGQPVQSIECTTDVCTCFEGEDIVGMCPAEGVCMGGDVQAKGADCCGFT